MGLTTVWLVEDNDVFAGAVQSLVEKEDDLACTARFDRCEALLDELDRRYPPDVVLMDVNLPGMSGVEGVARLRERTRHSYIVMVTVREDADTIVDAIRAGADGYLLKSDSADSILAAIRCRKSGGAMLTPRVARRVLSQFDQLKGGKENLGLTERELEVLGHLVDGRTKAELAVPLGISTHTVDAHVRSIYRKLQVNNRAAAVAKAVRHGVVDP